MEAEDQIRNSKEMAGHDHENKSETDAWPLSGIRRKENDDEQKTQDATDVSVVPKPVAISSCDRDAEEYNMQHPRRGVALIFNHELFKDMAPRTGSARDCASLSVELKNLGFEVRVHKDLTYWKLSDILRETAKEDHSTADCLMIVVMSHGDPGYLRTYDTVYRTNLLWEHFMGDKCPTLVGKPKLFFIQACRGDQVDSGVAVDQTDGYSLSYVIPVHADILVAYSTMEESEHTSWRDAAKGSWFIQALCEELRNNGRKRNLLTLLTFVCRRVTIEYQSFIPGEQDMHCKKQVPYFTSMLTRLVYFRERK